MNLNQYIDHTILKPTSTIQDIENHCKEAIVHKFAAVCVQPPFVKDAKEILRDTPVLVSTVIGFPFGYSATLAKQAECIEAIKDGADELDIVTNIIQIKSRNWDLISREWNTLLETCRLHRKTVKFIIESGELNDDEVIQLCALANKHKIDFLKTSTGYASKGATIHAVELMRSYLDPDISIKASGGIKDRATALQMIDAGVTRIGTSSSLSMIAD